MNRFLKPEEAVEYQILLESYHPNGQVVFDFAKSSFGTIDGPTGAGKDTLRNELIAQHTDIYKPVLSTTSRPPRPGEVEGVEYHFRDLKFIDQGLDDRRFLQAEMIHDQQISGLDFGDIADLNSSQFGIGILNVQAVKKLRTLNDTMKTIFIVPPSYEELLLRMQSSRSMKEDEKIRRLRAAKQEIEAALKDENYYLLTNADLSRSVQMAHAYFQTGDSDPQEELNTKQVMQQILQGLTTTS